MMLKLQALGQFSNTRYSPSRQASNCEQQLILLRLQSGCSGFLLTKMDKAAELITEFCQRLILGLRKVKISLHQSLPFVIISWHDIKSVQRKGAFVKELSQKRKGVPLTSCFCYVMISIYRDAI